MVARSESTGSNGTIWPPSASAWSSSATVVPARTRTVISAGSKVTTPDGARTSRASDDTEPPTSRCVHPVHHSRYARVEQQQRVEVAVAGMEDVHDLQVEPGGDVVDLAQYVHQLGAGHDGVVQVVIGGDARHRTERRLPTLPQQR